MTIAIAFTAMLLTGLAALAWYDIKYFRLPNLLTFPLIALGLLQGHIVRQDWQASALGALLGYIVFVCVELGFKALRGRDGLGRGDAKLLAVGGAWCGWLALPYIVLIGSLSGLIAVILPVMRNRTEQGWIPFGAFLAAAIAIVFLFVPSVAYDLY